LPALAATAVLLIVGGGALALGVLQQDTNQVFTEGLVAPTGPSPISSLLAPTSPVATMVAALSAPGLTKPGPAGAPLLGLASSFRSEANGSRWSFTLPRDGRWSDGAPITTRDVGFTLAVLQAADFPDPSLAAPWLGVTLEANSFWSGTFILPGPAPNFSTTAELPILPEAPYHDQPGRYLRQGLRPTGPFPPSAGPFDLSANLPDQVVLVRNQNYRPRPHISRFVIQLEPSAAAVAAQMAAGKVDGWLLATSSELQDLPHGVVREHLLTYSFVELLFNQSSPPLDNAAVRQAVAALVDRSALIARAAPGMARPQFGPLPDSISWAAGITSGGHPAAGQLLASAGYRRTTPAGLYESDGRPLQLRLAVPDMEPLTAVASAVAGQLSSAGIAVSVAAYPPESFLTAQLSKGEFQMALVGFDNGPTLDISGLFGGGAAGGANLGQGAADPILAHAIDQLATATSLSGRIAAYRVVVQELEAEAPAAFLYTPELVYAHLSAAHTPGLPSVGDPSQLFTNVAHWTG
jgi:ABC-type transport system substrate-binding protein